MGCYSVLKQHEHAHDDAIWTLCWASTSSLITGSLDTTAKVWSLQSSSGEVTLEEERIFDGFALGVISVDVAPKSSVAAIAAMDCKIRLFDLEKPLEQCELKTIDASPVDSWKIKLSRDGQRVATSSITGMINLYSTDAKEETTKTQLCADKFAFAINFSPDGRYLVAGNVLGIITAFDLIENKKCLNVEGHALPIRTIMFSQDSKLVISGSDDAQIKVHSILSGELVRTICGHGSWILDLDCALNGSHIASGSSDKKVKIWDMNTWECVQTFSHHTQQVTGVKYDPNGTRLASVSDDASIVIYDSIK